MCVGKTQSKYLEAKSSCWTSADGTFQQEPPELQKILKVGKQRNSANHLRYSLH